MILRNVLSQFFIVKCVSKSLLVSLCLKLFNLDEKIIGDTHAFCLRSVSRQLKRVAAEEANVRFLELDLGYGTLTLKAQALVRRPVERTEDKKLNLRLRQRGASGLLRIVNKSTSFLSFVRSKIGRWLMVERSRHQGAI